ncbi:MAG: ribosome small subunit-dependent GTPase A [Nocardioidaceae bacterium]
MSPRSIGEDDFDSYDRPRRHTRPRTKDRPSYPDGVPGFIVTVDRGRLTVRVGAGLEARNVFAVKARPLGRKGVVVGDDVLVVGDTSGAEGTLARIVEVRDRTTVLRRSADDDDPVERILVSNATQLVIVASVADPPPRPRLIDRCLVAAYAARLTPLLCLTKGDLADPDELLVIYRALGVSSVVTQRGAELGAVVERLRDQVSVLVGHSGVGKSTLVNALVPGAGRTTGIVNAVTGRGRHTSTSAYALELPSGGWVIDTPGIRSFGLAHVGARDIIGAFEDLDVIADDCPRGCTHGATEPECALDAGVAAGLVDPDRVDSFRRLLASRDGGD